MNKIEKIQTLKLEKMNKGKKILKNREKNIKNKN